MKKLLIMAIIAIALGSCSQQTENKQAEKTEQTQEQETVYDRASRLAPEIIQLLYYTEGFHSKPYHCGAAWTIGYGTTLDDEGDPITKDHKPINQLVGAKYMMRHLKKETLPFLAKDHKLLNDNQFVAFVSFAYNAGCGKGNVVLEKMLASKKKSQDEVFISRIFTVTTSKDKLAEGLTKRRWLEGAIFTGNLTTNDLVKLPACGYTKMDNASFHKTFFDKKKWVKYDQTTIDFFKEIFTKESIEKDAKQWLINSCNEAAKKKKR